MLSFNNTRVRSLIRANRTTIQSCFVALTCAAIVPSLATAQENQSDTPPKVQQKELFEPLYRVNNEETPRVASSSGTVKNKATNVLPVKAGSAVPATLPSATKPVAEPEVIRPSSITPSSATKPTSPPNVKPSTTPSASPVAAPRHPLDDALDTARRGLENMRANVKDYTAIMIKRERVNGELLDPEYMQLKIRNRRTDETGTTPLSMYMKFLKPRKCSGREVIWVEGQNNNQLTVHEGSGIVSLKTFSLDPDGWMAMQGNRYPIYEAGIENLIVKLIEKAERDRAAGHCEVKYRKGAKLNGRSCSVIEVCHPVKQEPYDFCNAKVFIDDELKMPIRYSAHIWPERGTKPLLLEEYTFLNLKLNPGLTDTDFDPSNPNYKFPGR